MRMRAIGAAILMIVAAGEGQVRADMVVDISFHGPGVSGLIHLTYGAATDEKYPDAYKATGISGTFTDTNLGITDAGIDALVPITQDAPESTNLLAPKDFSRFAVATGLPPENHNSLSYDNLYWPGGSPQTATDYPGRGGFLDIYGLLFTLDNGMTVNFWSNGDITGTGSIPVSYGIAVVTHDAALDYVGGATAVPEPGSLALLGLGAAVAVGALARRRAS